ncbi:hypothetical protein HGRIS_014278 [Hohenbuehelia grisea]|uniref:Uncharacterized protein n=1 Tax=Hohenbuehelia grisea TaxID=104357 RepID=A0ABR3JT42_9AGAR
MCDQSRPDSNTPMIQVAATPFGGRSYFATITIPCGALVLACNPYAHVVYRAYRKEVCAACLAFVGDQWETVSGDNQEGKWRARQGNWDIKSEPSDLNCKPLTTSRPSGPKDRLPQPNWRFCSSKCKARYFDTPGLEGNYLMAIVEDAIDAHARSLAEQARKTIPSPDAAQSPSERDSNASHRAGSSIGQDAADYAWAATEQYLSGLQGAKVRTGQRSPPVHQAVTIPVSESVLHKTSSTSSSAFDVEKELDFAHSPITELELDTVRFAGMALVRRCINEAACSNRQIPYDDSGAPNAPGLSPHVGEDASAASCSPCTTDTSSSKFLPTNSDAYPWAAVLALQSNELPHAHADPYALASSLRIYAFLRQAILQRLKPPPSNNRKRGTTSRLEAVPTHHSNTAFDGPRQDIISKDQDVCALLCKYVTTSDTVRAILAREDANVFGLYSGVDAPMVDESTHANQRTLGQSSDSEMLGFLMYIEGSYFNHCEFIPYFFCRRAVLQARHLAFFP